jgi:hypothetical protein
LYFALSLLNLLFFIYGTLQEDFHALLNVISKLPNSKVLLQKHFMAIISVVWILKYLYYHVTDIHSGAVDTFSPPKNNLWLTVGHAS